MRRGMVAWAGGASGGAPGWPRGHVGLGRKGSEASGLGCSAHPEERLSRADPSGVASVHQARFTLRQARPVSSLPRAGPAFFVALADHPEWGQDRKATRAVLAAIRAVLAATPAVLAATRAVLVATRAVLAATRAVLAATRAVLAEAEVLLSVGRLGAALGGCTLPRLGQATGPGADEAIGRSSIASGACRLAGGDIRSSLTWWARQDVERVYAPFAVARWPQLLGLTLQAPGRAPLGSVTSGRAVEGPMGGCAAAVRPVRSRPISRWPTFRRGHACGGAHRRAACRAASTCPTTDSRARTAPTAGACR